MSEKVPMGDMRLKVKDIVLPADTVKELGDLIPKPDDHFHYRAFGEYKPNTEEFRVQEGDKVISDYSFPEKSDMSKVQFASRKTYTKELNMWGNLKDKPVKFDRKTGTWKKLNFFESIKYAFNKETHIPAQVVTESVNGKDVPVLHTLEQKRPVGKSVQEAQLGTIQDAKVDLGLKYKHVDHTLAQLRAENNKLANTNDSQRAIIGSLRAQLIAEQLAETPTPSYFDRSSSNSYGDISFAQKPKDTPNKSNTPKHTPPPKNEKLDKRGDDVISQFEKNIKEREQKKQAEDAKLDEEYKNWIAHHPDKAYYENSGEPYPSKEEYVAKKEREAAAKKAARDGEERGLAKD